jgi:CheY-like chemotaxis protein
VGLSQLLRDFETTLSTIVPPHVELVMDLEEATWQVTADAIQIERIVMNLALNACDAMEQPGTLSISLHHVGIDSDDAWRPDHIEPGLYARLDVIDTGEGMSADVLARAFEPFFTTKPTGKGTGLGLATTYGIARQCGGHIDIQSSVGNGAKVSVYVPKAVGGETRSSLAVLGATRGERATILLVDDESSIRKTMSMRLQKQGYDVIEAADGEEAVNVAMAPGVRVDLLVSDVVMPRKDGPAVAAELIKVFPQMKTVLMSGYSERLSSEFDQLLPDVEFLVKPLRMKDLTETVARLLATRSEYH